MATTSVSKESSSKDGLSAIAESLDNLKLGTNPKSDLVDTSETVAETVDALYGHPTTPPSLYVDLEGVNLSRHGNISTLQIFVLPTHQTYLIDIYTLGDKAFSTCGANGCTLKDALESETIPKVFFDVRNDSDALYSHFGVKLAGVQDLQLMELATRTFRRSHVNGLSKCIERDAPLTSEERVAWKAAKEKGLQLFAPERGGSYEVFNERPLREEIRSYCSQDVEFLPRLWSYYNDRLTARWRARVHAASKDRVALSQSPDFNGKGQHMALAPNRWAWL